MRQAALVRVDDKFFMLELRAPLIHRDNHRQVFFLIHRRALISRAESLAHVGDWVPVLLQHRADALVTGVGLNGKGLGKLGRASTGALMSCCFSTWNAVSVDGV